MRQVEAALKVSTEGTDKENLISLSGDLRELISLTKDTIENAASNHSVHGDRRNEEFALFMAEMEKEGAVSTNEDKGVDAFVGEELKSLEGTKCRAPHKHHWGDTVYHNAMICSVFSDGSSYNDIDVSFCFVKLIFVATRVVSI